jgi:dienelactone hydrolase
MTGVLILITTISASGQVQLTTKTIEYKQNDATLRGYLAYDAALDSKPERRPAVIVVHEWYGLNEYAKRRARELAELGYVALAADIYGNGQNTTDPKEAGRLSAVFKNDRPLLRARAEAALEVLRDSPLVDRNRIACMGYCFGGMTALELARSGAPIIGAVSIHGVFESPTPKDIANFKGRLLVLHGTDDPFTPDVAAFEQTLREAKIDYTLIFYGNQGHAFTSPDADRLNMKGVGYDADADARSWRHLNLFLSEVLGMPFDAHHVDEVGKTTW